MYWLQTFNVDARGRAIDVTRAGGEFATILGAVNEANQLALATHYRVTEFGAYVVLEDSLAPASQAQAAD
jgi:hypothetical protein